MNRLHDKVCVVTGAGSGIGKASAEMFAAEGGSVVVTDLRRAAAEEVAHGIEAGGGRAIALGVDVGEEVQLRHMIETTIGTYGRIDVLYNNALFLNTDFVMRDLDFLEFDPEVFYANMRVNVLGGVLASRMAIPHMLPQGNGGWALIAGGTEGLGRAYADTLAAAGINLLLVARRQALLETVAAEIEQAHGVSVLPVALDLADMDAADRLAAAVGDRDLGLLIYNAGSDVGCDPFLSQQLPRWFSLIDRNVRTLTAVTHRFAPGMVSRGRGGLLIVCSEASLGGTATLAVYSATKAFELMLAESLWAELGPAGVDVLSVVIGTTDTPQLRRTLARSGFDPETVPLAKVGDIAVASLRRLALGPVFVFSELAGAAVEADRRREVVQASTAYVRRLMNAP